MADYSIPLRTRTVNALSAIGGGMQLGQQATDIRNAADFRSGVQQYGAAAMGGNRNALNALAGLGPEGLQMAQSTQMNNLNMDATRQGMAHAEAQQGRLTRAEQREIAAQMAQQDAAKLAAERDSLAGIFRGAAQFHAQGDQQGYGEWLRQNGINPADLPWGNFQAEMARFDADILPIYQEALEMASGPKPADEYGRYAAEERAAGREPLSRIDYAQAKKGEGIVMSMPDGTTVRVGGKGETGTVNPTSPQAMIASIDGILNDPALDRSTGIFSPLQSIPGTPQRRFGARANQLEGQAFLQAFESLKGGGQITEVEGIKATQAIGRLDTAQSADDYRQALTELRTLLEEASRRPAGWATSQADDLSDDDLLRKYGGE